MPIEPEITTVTRTSAHRFHLLDGLRGIAALIVVARHSPAQLTALLPVFNSFLAVDFFFCLSGFVIAYSYEDRLQHRLSIRDFTAARIIRLYPLAILGTLMGLAVMILRRNLWSSVPHGSLLIVTFLSLSILPNVIVPSLGTDLFPFNGPTWSLFFEMLANVIYAVIVRWKLAQTWIISAISTISLAALIFLMQKAPSLDGGAEIMNIYVGLARVGFSFFLGVLLFRLHRRSEKSGFHGAHGVLMSALCTGSLVAVLTVSTPLTRSVPYEFVAIILILPAIVYIGSKVQLPLGWTKACAFLGDLSYPLYILHHPLVAPLFSTRLIDLASTHRALHLFILPAYMVALACFAWWLGQYLDLPVRRMIAAKYKALISRNP